MNGTPSISDVAIAVTSNGGRKTKVDHPALPLGPDELAMTAVSCLEAGAAMIHMHVRTAEGRHLLDPDAYRNAIDAVRRSVGDKLLIQIASEALGLYSPPQQIAVVKETRPEAVSLAFGLHETACLTAAGLSGANLRTGFEINTAVPDGREAAASDELVAGLATALNVCGRGLADAVSLRSEMLRTLEPS